MIPIMETEIIQHGWMATEEFTNIIAIAGMSPGPIAVNMAILVGYSAAGLPGAIISTLGMLLPSLILVLIAASFFMKFHHHSIVHSVFYGLKPIVTSLIIYAAISFALSNHLVTLDISLHTISLLLIFLLSLFALLKLRWNPIHVIILSGLVGVVFYS